MMKVEPGHGTEESSGDWRVLCLLRSTLISLDVVEGVYTVEDSESGMDAASTWFGAMVHSCYVVE